MDAPKILIVGAGPTGLVLALWLARKGVAFRLVTKASGPGETSRAMVVQARTLELYRQLGIAEEAIERGIRMERLAVWENGQQAAHLSFDDLAQGESPYPFVLSFPQDDHERFLLEKLAAQGVTPEWETELVGFEEAEGRIRATLRHGEADETAEADYLCGCDGAHSAVRHGSGIGFPGGTYEQIFFVADVEAVGSAVDARGLSVCLGPDTLGLCFPVRSTGTSRLIGIVPPEAWDKADLGFEDVRAAVEPLLGLKVTGVNWFSKYRVHHRVAENFRQGRAFLLGDAGHVHSPAGGQGMNTGIGDAVNLAWKLAAVAKGEADPALLDTYEPERIAFARSLVQTTDRVFRAGTGRGIANRFLRTWLVPRLAPLAFRSSRVRRTAFDILSQTKIEYRESPLSEGRAGEIRGGDRLPWVAELDNFAPLRSLAWSLHVYGEPAEGVRDWAEENGVPFHAFPWVPGTQKAGLANGGTYLIRPDGYVAVAASTLRELAESQAARWRITPKPASG